MRTSSFSSFILEFKLSSSEEIAHRLEKLENQKTIITALDRLERKIDQVAAATGMVLARQISSEEEPEEESPIVTRFVGEDA